MKRITLLLFVFSTMILNAQFKIDVINQYPFDRVNELIEIKAASFGALSSNVVVKDSLGQEIPYQLTFNSKKVAQSIIFPITVKAGTKNVYKLSAGKPKAVEAKTSARFVPERKDDFAWENEFAAYRMYGPALAVENPSSGVDLWLKKTDKLVVDSFYRGDLKYGKSYHKDHGQGLDCYKVGKTLGAGGVSAYTDSTLWFESHFNKYEVLENGPLRSVFKLIYDTVKIKGATYKKTITITTSAGSLLNKAVVKYEGLKQVMQLATGIYLHDGKGSLQKGGGLIIYGEDAINLTDSTNMGKNYVAVVLPAKETVYKKSEKLHALLLTDYVVGTDFTYYFGGGWSQWKFPTQKDWLAAVLLFSKQVKYPVKVTVVKAP